MIFSKIYIENFGALHDFELSLSGGVNRVSGKNEFGKTTLLEFVRRLFWGFPDRRSRANQYPALNGSGRYGGWIEVIMDDGRAIRLERFGAKGRLRCYDMQTGQELPENEFDVEKLTNCKENFFRNVYAITVDELRNMEELESGELRQLLYGSGLGIPGKMLPALDKSLKSSCDELFRPRGVCRLKDVLAELKAAEDKLHEAEISAEQCSRAGAERDRLAERKEADHAELKRVSGKVNALKEMIRRRRLESEISALQKELASLPAVPGANEIKSLENIIIHLEAGEKNIIRMREELAALKERCAAEKTALSTFLICDRARPVDAALLDGLKSAERDAAAESEAAAKQLAAKKIWELIFGAGAIFLALAAYFSGVWWIFIPAALALAALPLAALKRQKTFPAAAELEKIYGKIAGSLSLKNIYSADKISELNYRCKHFRDISERCAAVEKELAACVETERSAAEKIDTAAGKHIEKNCRRTLIAGWKKASSDAEEIRLRIAEKEKLLTSLPAVDAELLTLTAAELNAALEERSAYYEKLMADYSVDSAEFGKAETLWQQLSLASDTAVAQTICAACKEEVKSVVSEYLISSIERKLLAEAIDKFESERQPLVLSAASEIFSVFTSGRYPKIRRRLDTGELVLRDEVSKTDKKFAELSRGTAEQLLLSLRLALIAVREQNSEKLPLILDDVTVNFDSERSAQAAAALEEFARGRQLIILSCR